MTSRGFLLLQTSRGTHRFLLGVLAVSSCKQRRPAPPTFVFAYLIIRNVKLVKCKFDGQWYIGLRQPTGDHPNLQTVRIAT